MGFTIGDSIASQSRYSLPSFAGFIVTSVSAAGIELSQKPTNESSASQFISVAKIPHPEENQPALLAPLEKLTKVKRRKKRLTCVNCLEKVGPIQFAEVLVMKEVGSSLKKCCSEFFGPKGLQRDLKILKTTVTNFPA